MLQWTGGHAGERCPGEHPDCGSHDMPHLPGRLVRRTWPAPVPSLDLTAPFLEGIESVPDPDRVARDGTRFLRWPLNALTGAVIVLLTLWAWRRRARPAVTSRQGGPRAVSQPMWHRTGSMPSDALDRRARAPLSDSGGYAFRGSGARNARPMAISARRGPHHRGVSGRDHHRPVGRAPTGLTVSPLLKEGLLTPP
jgi:hypothetical protein